MDVIKEETKMKYKKGNTGKVVLSLFSIAVLLFSGFNIYKSFVLDEPSFDGSGLPGDNINPSTPGGTIDKVESNDLKIRNMKTTTNDSGNQVISFNYQVLPEEATDKSVTLSLSWSDSSVSDDINDYLSYTHNQSSYYIEVTLLQRSNNQGKLVLTSKTNSNATATVFIDYEQEFLGWNLAGDVVLEQTFSLTSSETINDLEDFKAKMMTYSKGFTGTVAAHSKEITNIQLTLNSVAVTLANPSVIPFINNNSEFNTIYENAREENTSSINFINELGSYIETLSNEEKITLRGSETATITAKYKVTFDFYGESYEYTLAYVDTVSTSAFASSTFIPVDSITTEGNIIFGLESEPEEITDLTNTTWNIPAGWTATAGYGIFNINYIDSENDYQTENKKIALGYMRFNFDTLIFTDPTADYINLGGPSACEIGSSQTFTITITGGTDATNPDLISWLQENGTIINLINFSINTVSYQAEDGMTWEEWVNSSYNTDGYTIGNAMGFTAVQKGNNYITGSSSPSTTLIESDKKYTTNSLSGGANY